LLLLTAATLAVLTACGGGTPPPPSAAISITAPEVGAEVVTGTMITVEGSAVEGAEVFVSIGSQPAVAAAMLASANGRQQWSAQLTAPSVGDHLITATFTSPETGDVKATVAVKVVPLKPYGAWSGLFYIDRRPNGGELEDGGTMIVWYGSKWFRMYFAQAGIDVEGTTDGWDLVDKAGLRILGTYHAAGETNEDGLVMDEPWVDYFVELDNGDIITGKVEVD